GGGVDVWGVVVVVLRLVGALVVPARLEGLARRDPAAATAAEARGRGAEDLLELDRSRLRVVGDAGDRIRLPGLVVLRADVRVHRALAHGLLAAHDRFDGVLVVLAGERCDFAP